VAQEVHAFIRSVLAKKYGQDLANKIIIQYGGSVKPDNVKEVDKLLTDRHELPLSNLC
jgi:triosephosphate isomerase (TIM)